MQQPYNQRVIVPPPATQPILTVVVHTEEEFNWRQGFKRENTSVDHLLEVDRIQDIFDRFNIKPVYVVGHPVVAQRNGYGPLRAIADSGRAEIGSHLHPWVAPPYTEEVSIYNSYPGNLDRADEQAKILALTEKIAETFGAAPRSYAAGRYGIGPNTAGIIGELGYEVDISTSPGFDFSADGGPDFSGYSNKLSWLDEQKNILGIANTGAFVGLLHQHYRTIQPLLGHKTMRALRLGGILSRLNLYDRLRLSPEGHTQSELQTLTGFLLAQGIRHFVFSFHSPSIKPGCTPYVQNKADLDRFLQSCHAYFTYFLEDLEGTAMTAQELQSFVQDQSW